MKNNFLHLFIIILCNVELIAHSYSPYSDIPEKYETWKNHNSLKENIIDFDFFDYDFSCHERFIGFEGSGKGALYGDKMSKYIIKNRNFLLNLIGICIQILDTEYIQKSKLNECLQTYKLVYDQEELLLFPYIKTKLISTNRSKPYDYGSVKSVLFIDKELFLKIVSAKELYFEYVLDGVVYRIPLQVPVLEDLPIEPYGQKAAGFGYIEVFFTLKDDSYQIADYNCNIESHFSFDEESGAEYPDPDGTIVYHKDLSQEEFLNILFDKSLGF